jgi:agmatine deiminase
MTKNRIFPAEWYSQSAVAFTFPHADSDWASLLDKVIPTFVEIISILSLHQIVLVVCHDIEEVTHFLKSAYQPNLRLVQVPSNDTWARDHSAITILEDGQPILLDFIFNGWGLKFPANHDNQITRHLAKKGIFNSIPIATIGLAVEGGALESDGEGTLLTTSECLLSYNRNPQLPKEDTEDVLKEIFGLERILWLDHGFLAGDDTDSHIDTLARFCDPVTITYVTCDDPNDIHYEALKAMEEQLKSFKRLDGSPYRFIPLPMGPIRLDDEGNRLPSTYANFLIFNGGVLLPIYGDEDKDNQAIIAMEKCFPDRKIYAVDCNTLIQQHGSLHCITMQFPKEVIH